MNVTSSAPNYQPINCLGELEWIVCLLGADAIDRHSCGGKYLVFEPIQIAPQPNLVGAVVQLNDQ
jgi:hypothetical protein